MTDGIYARKEVVSFLNFLSLIHPILDSLFRRPRRGWKRNCNLITSAPAFDVDLPMDQNCPHSVSHLTSLHVEGSCLVFIFSILSFIHPPSSLFLTTLGLKTRVNKEIRQLSRAIHRLTSHSSSSTARFTSSLIHKA